MSYVDGFVIPVPDGKKDQSLDLIFGGFIPIFDAGSDHGAGQ